MDTESTENAQSTQRVFFEFVVDIEFEIEIDKGLWGCLVWPSACQAVQSDRFESDMDRKCVLGYGSQSVSKTVGQGSIP